MNSTLQCLSQTKALTNYFLNENNRDKILSLNNQNMIQLSPIYFELIHKLWDKNSEQTSFGPNDFMNKINEMNPLFKKGEPGDSKDFIIFILEKIHKELKISINLTIKIILLKASINMIKIKLLIFFLMNFKMIVQLYQIFSLDLLK